MSLFHCHFHSESLAMQMSVDVIVPQEPRSRVLHHGRATREYPCLWLLHGLSDDHTSWQRQTAIERYVDHMGLAVVMPQVHRSFYADMAYGHRYWTYISKELPHLVRNAFRISPRREDNFAAGLSMGGYGALKLALRCPDRFAAAASLSGTLDVVTHFGGMADFPGEIQQIFGSSDNLHGPENDLFEAAIRVSKSEGHKPKLYLWCGVEDSLLRQNQSFGKLCRDLKLPVTYREGAGGHDWESWDREIRTVLEWLPIEGVGQASSDNAAGAHGAQGAPENGRKHGQAA